MKRLWWLILLLFSLLPQPVQAYYGAGQVLCTPRGYFVPIYFDGDSSGFGKARDLCIRRGGGNILVGPGMEGVTLTYPSDANISVIRNFISGWSVDPFNSVIPSSGGITSVKTYGAVGDSLTDDTNAVLAAISATATGGRLYFPTGKYRLGTWSVQTITKIFSVVGDGIGNSKVIGNGANSFFSCTNNIEVYGLTFDKWSIVFDFSSINNVLTDVYFHDMEIKNYDKGIYASNASANRGINNLKIFNSKFSNATSYPIYINLDFIEKADIRDNKIQKSIQRGINLGNNTESFANHRGLYSITGNFIDSVSAIDPATSLGIAVYGWRANISGNIIQNVYKNLDSLSPDLDATDANGIYTKCRFATINHNVIVDGGQSEAFINVKGIARDETATTSPKGFGVTVDGNVLIDTGTTGRKTKAIKMACSEISVINNYIEGHTDVGIYTDSDAAHDYLVQNNFIKSIRGNSGITIFGKGKRIRILNNTIDSVANSFDSTAQNTGIKIQKSGGGEVDIVGNRVQSIRNTGTTPVGILIKPSAVITGVRVADNDIDGAAFGVQFSSNAPDSVFVRDNRGRHIYTNLLQYSVTPTNLTDGSITPVFSFNGSNTGEMKNGTNPQIVRVYNTFTDGSNYERFFIAANSSNARIGHENAGTGTARSLEINMGGTSYWRWTTSGHFQPMTDNQVDIGAVATRVRDLFLSKRIYMDYTNTGTIGNVTISKPTGRVNVTAAATTVVVTNTLVTAASHVFVVASQNDATGRVLNVVPAAGSFTINCTAPTANMSVDFLVINAD